ncbi:hypothetical protein C5C42_17230 [Rathayibacter sp. AY1F7]|nr:hypothetical protein C5C54_17430 [Rathayibacter sp. AY1F2]PPG99850.1 hypothetical protein C5C32_10390 [Rathayibacter sp. AY1G9]PPH40775.1 hypothetical protein C5C42_17230 [Rathayibacter sp. AY1F7]
MGTSLTPHATDRRGAAGVALLSAATHSAAESSTRRLDGPLSDPLPDAHRNSPAILIDRI